MIRNTAICAPQDVSLDPGIAHVQPKIAACAAAERPVRHLTACCREMRELDVAIVITKRGPQRECAHFRFLSSPVASLDAQSVDSRPGCEACLCRAECVYDVS